jgi:hypothetical protein
MRRCVRVRSFACGGQLRRAVCAGWQFFAVLSRAALPIRAHKPWRDSARWWCPGGREAAAASHPAEAQPRTT